MFHARFNLDKRFNFCKFISLFYCLLGSRVFIPNQSVLSMAGQAKIFGFGAKMHQFHATVNVFLRKLNAGAAPIFLHTDTAAFFMSIIRFFI